MDLAAVVRGEGPAPSLVLSLVQRLPDTSMTAAIAAGGREFFGWGMDRQLAAVTYDAINQNTRACGNWGKKGPPAIPEFPRPQADKKTKAASKKKATVKDLYGLFARR